MDSLIVVTVVFGAPLTLFSVLYAAERLSARRHRRKVERRLLELRRYPHPIAVNPSRSPENGHKYGLTWPATRTRPYQRKAR